MKSQGALEPMSFCSVTCIVPGGCGLLPPIKIGLLLDYCVHKGAESPWSGSRLVDPGNKLYKSMMCLICGSVRQVSESKLLTDQRAHLHSVTLAGLSQVHIGDIFEAILGLFELKNTKANVTFSDGFQCDDIADSVIANYVAALTELYVLRLLTKWGCLMVFGKSPPSSSSRVLFDFQLFYLAPSLKGTFQPLSIKEFFRMLFLTAGFWCASLEVFLRFQVFK